MFSKYILLVIDNIKMFSKYILLVIDNIKIQINTTFSILSNFYNNNYFMIII